MRKKSEADQDRLEKIMNVALGESPLGMGVMQTRCRDRDRNRDRNPSTIPDLCGHRWKTAQFRGINLSLMGRTDPITITITITIFRS